MADPRLDRRAFLGLAGVALVQAPPVQDSIGRLPMPTVVGRFHDTTAAGDNDARIQALEKRLKCPCPCGLDVYTCRTTDFTCTYSPATHREVLALWDEGRREEEILAYFVARDGERALMAPAPRGFNLAAYLLPGALILLLGSVLAFVLLRRRSAALPAAAASGDHGVGATSAELDALEREIREDA